MSVTACSQCGEEISPKWIVCPICSHPAGERPEQQDRADDFSLNFGKEILCTKCKKEISPDTQICPHCHVPIIRRYCSGCQRLIPDHVNLCPYCRAVPSAKKGLGKMFKAALFLGVSVCAVLLYLLFYRSDAPTEDAAKSRIRESQAAEIDRLQNDSPPQLLSKPPIPLTTSPVETAQIKPVPLPSNTVVEIQKKEEIQKEEEPKKEERKIQPAPDFAARGARLKQGRKLQELGSRLIKQKQYTKAAYVLNDAVRAFPAETKDLSYGEALYYLGYSLRMSGKPADAIPVLKRALDFPFTRSKAAKELKSASDQIKKTQPVQWVKP